MIKEEPGFGIIVQLVQIQTFHEITQLIRNYIISIDLAFLSLISYFITNYKNYNFLLLVIYLFYKMHIHNYIYILLNYFMKIHIEQLFRNCQRGELSVVPSFRHNRSLEETLNILYHFRTHNVLVLLVK